MLNSLNGVMHIADGALLLLSTCSTTLLTCLKAERFIRGRLSFKSSVTRSAFSLELALRVADIQVVR